MNDDRAVVMCPCGLLSVGEPAEATARYREHVCAYHREAEWTPAPLPRRRAQILGAIVDVLIVVLFVVVGYFAMRGR